MSVAGIDKFRNAMTGFEDDYVLIGGSACDLLMGERGVEFRATKDLDVVVLADHAGKGFARALWSFVRAGGYEPWASSGGAIRFYRFASPSAPGYPRMLELFARHGIAPTRGAVCDDQYQLGPTDFGLVFAGEPSDLFGYNARKVEHEECVEVPVAAIWRADDRSAATASLVDILAEVAPALFGG